MSDCCGSGMCTNCGDDGGLIVRDGIDGETVAKIAFAAMALGFVLGAVGAGIFVLLAVKS